VWHKPWLLVVLLDQAELAFDCRKLDLLGEVPNMSAEIEHLLALVSLGGKIILKSIRVQITPTPLVTYLAQKSYIVLDA
jgi:hypothetical protein